MNAMRHTAFSVKAWNRSHHWRWLTHSMTLYIGTTIHRVSFLSVAAICFGDERILHKTDTLHTSVHLNQTYLHQTHTHLSAIWWIWAARQDIKGDRRINLNDLWKILVMTFMNTLWNIENVIINFYIGKWGRNIKQTALKFERGPHVKPHETAESAAGREREKKGGCEKSILSYNSYSGAVRLTGLIQQIQILTEAEDRGKASRFSQQF